MSQPNYPSKKDPSAMVLPYAWVILVVVYFGSVVAPFNQFKIPPVMPVLMRAFQIDLTQAGWLMSIVAIFGVMLALPAAAAMQRFGPKVTGLAALICLAAGAALGALAKSFPLLMGSRMIEGVGVGLISVVAPATIAMWFPPSRQGAPMGIWSTWVPVGTVVTYNLAPAYADRSGWQAVWWVGAGFALIMVVIFGLLVRQPPAAQPDEPRGTQERDLPLPAGEELQRLSILRSVLGNRNIQLLAVEFACFSLVLITVGTYYPTFLSEVRGYPLTQASFITSLFTLVVLVSSPLGGWVSDRIGSRRLTFSLPFLLIAVLMLFPYQVVGGQIIALMIILGFTIGFIPTATFAAAPEIMRRPEMAGVGMAMVLIGGNLGNLIGPVLFSELVKIFGWTWSGYLMIPFCLVGFLSGWRIKIR